MHILWGQPKKLSGVYINIWVFQSASLSCLCFIFQPPGKPQLQYLATVAGELQLDWTAPFSDICGLGSKLKQEFSYIQSLFSSFIVFLCCFKPDFFSFLTVAYKYHPQFISALQSLVWYNLLMFCQKQNWGILIWPNNIPLTYIFWNQAKLYVIRKQFYKI